MRIDGRVPYLNWRDGRPRWEPGPALRRRGWKGRDLKDGRGNWLDLGAAMDAAREINAEVKAARQRPRYGDGGGLIDESRASNGEGFVYFLVCGEHVKIGFSADPFTRSRALRTGLPQRPNFMMAVPGTLALERELHRRLAEYRSNGEWFHMGAAVQRQMAALQDWWTAPERQREQNGKSGSPSDFSEVGQRSDG